MPSAANGKSEKPASSEATDNSPVRQILTIIDHKIRNLEKRKSKLTSYRDLQKSGKELNSDQRTAVAKYDEVFQTLEFARDLSKQMASIAISAEREAKKQAKKEAWTRSNAETAKIREVLLILDVLMQMGTPEVREDFLNGVNGAAKLTEDDLKILDNLYPEVTPKHELNEEGEPVFEQHASRAADLLCQITDGRPKEVLGTTFAHIKQIVASVHACGYFDKSEATAEPEEAAPAAAPAPASSPPPSPAPAPPLYAPPPPPAAVPPPAYPLRPLPPITLQEVEHAYFANQYPVPQPRPISEVIGSQNFFFLQESEIESPAGTPAPPVPVAGAPPLPIPSQTFTNQHFVIAGRAPDAAAVPLPQPHFAPLDLPPAFPAAAPAPSPASASAPASAPAPAPASAPAPAPASPPAVELASPEPRPQGQGDGQGRYRRYPRASPRAANNGYRGRYRAEYQGQGRGGKDGYQPRQYDGYQRRGEYCGNGDGGEEGYRPRGGRARGGRGGGPRAHYRPRGDRDRDHDQ